MQCWRLNCSFLKHSQSRILKPKRGEGALVPSPLHLAKCFGMRIGEFEFEMIDESYQIKVY